MCLAHLLIEGAGESFPQTTEHYVCVFYCLLLPNASDIPTETTNNNNNNNCRVFWVLNTGDHALLSIVMQ